jgi:hypothetical protein
MAAAATATAKPVPTSDYEKSAYAAARWRGHAMFHHGQRQTAP